MFPGYRQYANTLLPNIWGAQPVAGYLLIICQPTKGEKGKEMYIYFDYYRLFGSVQPQQGLKLNCSFAVPGSETIYMDVKAAAFCVGSLQWISGGWRNGEVKQPTVAWAAASRPVKHLNVAL